MELTPLSLHFIVYTLGPVYKEFGYYEILAIMRKFFSQKPLPTDIDVEKFSYNEYYSPRVTFY